MHEVGICEQRMRASFRLDQAPTLVTRSLHRGEIAVSDCRADRPRVGLSDSFPEDDAYIVGLQLRDYPDCENWEYGRCVSKTDVMAGETHLYDMRRDPRFIINKPFHGMFFYVPRSAFDAIAEDARAPRIAELDYAPGVGRSDEVVRNLGASMLAALARPEQANRIFVDHVTLALTAHVAQTYGGLRRIVSPSKGGLAGWQQKRACEMLAANLDGAVPLKEVAAECGLSTSHFSRAFRQSLGVAPHTWLLRRRIEVAKALLKDRRMPLSEIALIAGFADQSHFTRIFSKSVGVSPGIWRRCLERETGEEA